MKKILILLLALMPFTIQAQDYKYIDFSQTSDDFSRVVTKQQIISHNGLNYDMRFCYSKFEYSELYYIILLCSNSPYKWEVYTGDMATFKMADGAEIALNAPMDSSINGSADEYIIAASYKIPTSQVQNMLNAILSITIERRINGEVQKSAINVNHETAAHLMLAYLELLAITGK